MTNMQYKKFCAYEGYHSSYDFTVYDIAFVFVDEDGKDDAEYIYDYYDAYSKNETDVN
jgi:hypothetical protein